MQIHFANSAFLEGQFIFGHNTAIQLAANIIMEVWLLALMLILRMIMHLIILQEELVLLELEQRRLHGL
jgi:hypothetical protein